MIQAARDAALVALLVLTVPAAAAAQVAPARVSASIGRIFGPLATMTHVRADTSDVLRVTRGDSLLGFALVRSVMGKEEPIVILVAMDRADSLKDVDILEYREPYGGEVAYESWRRQFRGRTVAAPLEPGRDIRGISGATISVNAVTLGVRRALADLTRWHRAGVLR